MTKWRVFSFSLLAMIVLFFLFFLLKPSLFGTSFQILSVDRVSQSDIIVNISSSGDYDCVLIKVDAAGSSEFEKLPIHKLIPGNNSITSKVDESASSFSFCCTVRNKEFLTQTCQKREIPPFST